MSDSVRTGVTLPLAGRYAFAGAIKVKRLPQSLEVRDRHGVPAPVWTAIGVTELACTAGVLAGLAVKPIGVATSAALTAQTSCAPAAKAPEVPAVSL
jgi:uncharacterized membrane protein YphA (DoxX/SURF4 family)